MRTIDLPALHAKLDELILVGKAENTFIGFLILAKSVGAKVIQVPRRPDYKYDIEAMAKKIKDLSEELGKDC